MAGDEKRGLGFTRGRVYTRAGYTWADYTRAVYARAADTRRALFTRALHTRVDRLDGARKDLKIEANREQKRPRADAMAEYRLHCFAQSGNAYKAALMLQLCGANWEPRFVDYFNGETRTPAFRAVNVMGEVPLLEHGTLQLVQSGVILDYLADQLGRFGPESEAERREVLRWLLFDNHKLTSYTATLRFLRTFGGTREGPVIDFLRTRSNGALGVLDSHLSAHAFALGGRPTIADLSMCGYLFWPEEIGVDWGDFPNIGAWLERIGNLPGWVHPYELMPGHPLPDPD